MSKDDKASIVKGSAGPLGFVFFVAWIGAVIYFVQQYDVLGGFIVAILQSFVWPAYVTYHVLTLLHA